MTITDTPRGRGRPKVGDRVVVRLPPEMLWEVDQRATAAGTTRADEIRHLIALALEEP